MWDLPGPGLEPVSPALAGGFLTTAPPGKSHDWLLSLNVFKVHHVVACTLFPLWPNNIPLYGYSTFYLSIHQLRDIWVFPLLRYYEHSCTTFCVDICFNFSWSYIPRSGIAGSYGNAMFSLLRNCQIVFQSVCTILHSQQQSMRITTSLHPY